MPTETHEKVWHDYEYILTIRANITMCTILAHNLIGIMSGDGPVSSSELFIAEEP